MELFAIDTGIVKFDGGSMFGIIPKVIWHEQYPADKRNYSHWAMRCLLVVDGERKILIDTGIGTKQSKNFIRYYTEKTDYSLQSSLEKHGFACEDITDIVLTHLHFDHCGGCIQFDENNKPVLAFPNAIIHVSKQQLDWALNPNDREAPSFLGENILPILDSGKLNLIDYEHELFPGFYIKLFNGHTEGQIIPHIKVNDKIFVFGADLFPSTTHIPVPYIMAYDTRPLLTIEDKKRFFAQSNILDYIIFFEHDLYVECCTLIDTDKGVKTDRTFTLDEYFKR